MFNKNRCMDMSMNMDMGKDMNYPKAGSDCMTSTKMEGEMIPGVVCAPIYECPVERVCHRQIVHEVPHVCPCNTRIVNHHIYRHTYSPCYTCCEENEVCNVYENKCCY